MGAGKFYLAARLTGVLKRWRPKKKSPLPPPDLELMEHAAAKEWGLLPHQWRALPASERAEMLTHEIISNVREAYSAEKMLDDSKKKNGKDDGEYKPPNDFVMMKQRTGRRDH